MSRLLARCIHWGHLGFLCAHQLVLLLKSLSTRLPLVCMTGTTLQYRRWFCIFRGTGIGVKEMLSRQHPYCILLGTQPGPATHLMSYRVNPGLEHDINLYLKAASEKDPIGLLTAALAAST